MSTAKKARNSDCCFTTMRNSNKKENACVLSLTTNPSRPGARALADPANNSTRNNAAFMAKILDVRLVVFSF